MEKIAETKSELRKEEFHYKAEKQDFLASMADDFFLKPSMLTILTYMNLVLGYFVGVLLISGHEFSFWNFLVYLPLIYIIYSWRLRVREKTRLEIAHRMPYFADALANSLSVGSTLEQAFKQSSHYLKGKIKVEFHMLILKNSLGKDLGLLLEEMDNKFPNTGLRYLISLLKQYRELGIGISPMLKRIAVALALKEEAEEKIRTILAAGSGYARLAIGTFGCIFLLMSVMLKGQIGELFSTSLQPIMIFLICWTSIGIFLVTRITSMKFAKNLALRPAIKSFTLNKSLSLNDLFFYSGMNVSPKIQNIIKYSPVLAGAIFSYIVSLYNKELIMIFASFVAGAFIFSSLNKTILKGFVEDQLISTIETFPDFLQVFIIGLNSGLNTFLAFEFAQEALRGAAPKILTGELIRSQFAMQCGEENSKTWFRLSEKLPFETIKDFCEIMVVAPMHGESIVDSIVQMSNSYQNKKLTIIEKKATQLGQLVIPVIVIAFFPLFLFVIFAPLIERFSFFVK